MNKRGSSAWLPATPIHRSVRNALREHGYPESIRLDIDADGLLGVIVSAAAELAEIGVRLVCAQSHHSRLNLLIESPTDPLIYRQARDIARRWERVADATCAECGRPNAWFVGEGRYGFVLCRWDALRLLFGLGLPRHEARN